MSSHRPNVTAKKSKEKRPKKQRPEDYDDDDDFNAEPEAEELEPIHAKRKRQKGRKAFTKLLRWLLSFVTLAMVLAQQPALSWSTQPEASSLRVCLVPVLACSPAHPSSFDQ